MWKALSCRQKKRPTEKPMIKKSERKTWFPFRKRINLKGFEMIKCSSSLLLF
ncbi:hypothetical protein Bca4012_046079 [Brassica carinata]